MKRLLLAASTLGFAFVLSLGLGATPGRVLHAPRVQAGQDVLPAATDDPMPVDCPFCGGDPQLHARRINDIAVTSSRIAYSLLDASIF